MKLENKLKELVLDDENSGIRNCHYPNSDLDEFIYESKFISAIEKLLEAARKFDIIGHSAFTKDMGPCLFCDLKEAIKTCDELV